MKIYALYARCFARARFVKWNYTLLQFALRGLGVMNYQNSSLTGEVHFLRQFLKNKSSPVIFDVGANVGEYARLVREYSVSARLVCFEPHPHSAVKLRTRKNLDIELVEKAVGDKPGELLLYDYADNDGSSHASVYRQVIEDIHKATPKSHAVKVITLDQYCADNAIERIHLLKIDTEGHELAVLQGARDLLANNAIDVIHFEFNEMNIISRVFLRDFRVVLPNYQLYRLLPRGWIPLRYDRTDEIFAFQNIIAINSHSSHATKQ